MKKPTKIAVLIGGASVLTALLAGCIQDQRKLEMQQRMHEDAIRFEAYTRGFRDGIFATVKHEMPGKKTLEIAPILAEMRPHEDR